MLRTIPLQPPPGAWISYQVDELLPDGTWGTGVAANEISAERPLPPARAVNFSPNAEGFRVVWVGVGGSRNMLLGEPQSFDARPARVRR